MTYDQTQYQDLLTQYPDSAARCTPVAASLALTTPVTSSAAPFRLADVMVVAPPPTLVAGQAPSFDGDFTCRQAFQIAPIDNGGFTMMVAPGTYYIRVFYANGQMADLGSAVGVGSGTAVTVTLPR